jgi:4-amino-4-deoxy-L-arabinose transferase-like glycosyltransferase
MRAGMNWIAHQVAKGRGLGLALLVMLAVALPGFFSLPPIDRDEVLFSQASKQMLASGDWVDIRFADAPRYKKPVGIYWMQATAAAVTGQADQIWSYRLISLLGALLAVGFTHATARLYLGREAAFLAAVALGASLMLGAEAHFAKTDAMLLATVAAGQYVLARGARDKGLSWGLAMGFWATLAVSTLIKGPIGPMVMALTLVGQCGVARSFAPLVRLRPLAGLPVFVALAAPWFIAISYVSDGAFWNASLGVDMFEKMASAQEKHGAPPGSYLAAIWLTFWPAAMPLAASLAAIWAGRREAVVQFALLSLLPTWLIFEALPTKLVHYTLPTYPALALLVAYAVQSGALRRLWPMALAGLLPLGLLAALVWQAGLLGVSMPLTFWIGALAVTLSLGLILWAARRGAVPLAVALALGGMALNATIYPTLAGIDALWPSRPLAAMAANHPDCGFRVAGYAEPSLVFLTDARVQFEPQEQIMAALSAPGCQVIALPSPDAPAGGLQALGRVTGLDLGTGRRVDLSVWLKP